MKKIVGVTGGIASGKSTVTAYLKKQGYAVIDSDQVVHELQAPGQPLYLAILKAFGPGFFDRDGYLDRKKLGALVFSDSLARQKLSEVQDAIIREELIRRKTSFEGNLLFMDIPLLFELHYQELVDQIWVVTVPEIVQLDRLLARNHLTLEEGRDRLRSQLSLKDKTKLADLVLDNSKRPEDLYNQIDEQLDLLMAQSENED